MLRICFDAGCTDKLVSFEGVSHQQCFQTSAIAINTFCRERTSQIVKVCVHLTLDVWSQVNQDINLEFERHCLFASLLILHDYGFGVHESVKDIVTKT